MNDMDPSRLDVTPPGRRLELARYAALGACAYMLAYLGWQLSEGGMGLTLTLLTSLAATGTLLARERSGPLLAVAAGVLGALEARLALGVQLSARAAVPAPDGQRVALAGLLAAALVLAITGAMLMRAAPRRSKADDASGKGNDGGGPTSGI